MKLVYLKTAALIETSGIRRELRLPLRIATLNSYLASSILDYYFCPYFDRYRPVLGSFMLRNELVFWGERSM